MRSFFKHTLLMSGLLVAPACADEDEFDDGAGTEDTTESDDGMIGAPGDEGTGDETGDETGTSGLGPGETGDETGDDTGGMTTVAPGDSGDEGETGSTTVDAESTFGDEGQADFTGGEDGAEPHRIN